jgi:peptidoglycan/xylan/chitin deacetylase (PgdA/CDA1 family)
VDHAAIVRYHSVSTVRRFFLVLVVALLATGVVMVDAPPVVAATRQVRLEAGPQTGYRFSSTGAVVARKDVVVVNPAGTTTDRRRVVPNRAGIYLRITSGTLSGYEVRESAVAHIPGIAGDTAYAPAATVALAAGRYLGYRFDGTWDLASTKYGALAAATTAKTSRRAVIDGRPYVLLTTGTWSGTWMPVTAPRGLTAARIACSAPARPSAGPSVVLRRIPTSQRGLALTFDLGGRLTPAIDILERLIVDRVCSTIHPTGDAALTTTGTAVMALVKAHPELFEVGNHTMHHCNLRDGGGGAICPKTPPTAARIQAELIRGEETIGALTGLTAKPYWRPPYGAYDTRVRAAAAAVGYSTTLMWDIDTIDWKTIADGGPTTAAIADKVVRNAKTGSIVLMHLGGYHTFDALPSMVMRLRAAGLQPTTISDLLD